MKQNTTEAIYFLCLLLLFFLACKAQQMWQSKLNLRPVELSYVLFGIVFTLCAAILYYVSNVRNCSSSETFWDVSDAAKCKGGPYFWQGNSENSVRCRAMASTPQGRCDISSYNCPTGYNGQPKIPFVYTPVSDDSWKNERCDDTPACTCQDVGMCSMEKQYLKNKTCSN